MYRFGGGDAMYPNRLYCDTLSEMRSILKHINIFNYKPSAAILWSLVEECQVYGNRMEAGLEYGRDLHQLHEKRKLLNEEVKKLKQRVKDLGGDPKKALDEDDD